MANPDSVVPSWDMTYWLGAVGLAQKETLKAALVATAGLPAPVVSAPLVPSKAASVLKYPPVFQVEPLLPVRFRAPEPSVAVVIAALSEDPAGAPSLRG